MGVAPGRGLDTGWGELLTLFRCAPPQVRVIMGSEEVRIQGRGVSVKGQLVPEGESRLLHGEDPVGLRWRVSGGWSCCLSPWLSGGF